MNNLEKHLLQLATGQLKERLLQHRLKPYLPIWGELYCSLRDIRRISLQLSQHTVIYELQPTGRLVYNFETDKFRAEVEELHFTLSMSMDELLESLLQGRFAPKME
ncbi:hypothetical protein ACTID9_00130 [Brevibacillus fluminis]|uniref:hypothetical protein n=1 Tax=Brevibacillus fluminis TaxID=511487 RepID=UPI003F8BA3B9